MGNAVLPTDHLANGVPKGHKGRKALPTLQLQLLINPQNLHLQTLNLLQRFPRYPLQIAIHAHGGVHHPLDLRLAFGPLLDDGFAFFVQVFLQGGEGFDDGFYSLFEA